MTAVQFHGGDEHLPVLHKGSARLSRQKQGASQLLEGSLPAVLPTVCEDQPLPSSAQPNSFTVGPKYSLQPV